jgi:hypothetical protein
MPVFLKDLNSAFKSMRNLFCGLILARSIPHLTIWLGRRGGHGNCGPRRLALADGNLMMRRRCGANVRLKSRHTLPTKRACMHDR